MTVQLARIQGNSRGNATDFLNSLSGGQTWMADGLCANHPNPDLWFPAQGAYRGPTQAAINICRGCPVRFECLEYALEKPERDGIWGAMGEEDRARMRKTRQKQEAKRRAQEAEGAA